MGRRSSAATHALVYQMKSNYGDWRYPVAYYLTDNSTTGETLANFSQEVIRALIKAGFRVRMLVGDGLQANVKMAFLLGARDGEPFFFVDGHKIYCISDPPHLLKAVRNALIKYAFVFSGKEAKWEDVVKFFFKDASFIARLAHKLRKEHIYPNNYDKMRVNLAAQVSSNSVAVGLFTHVSFGHLPMSAVGTAETVQLIDRVFDSFNGRVMPSEETARKPHRVALCDSSPHWQFWQEFAHWLDNVSFRNLNTQKVRKNLPFQKAWKNAMTGMTMLYLDLKGEGRDHLPKGKINQDDLENLYALIRFFGGHCLLPTVTEFEPALHTAFFNVVITPRGNCEINIDRALIELRQLFDDDNPLWLPNPAANQSAQIQEVLDEDIEPDVTALESFHSEELSAQAEPIIAGSLAKKVLKKIGECDSCKTALLQAPGVNPYVTMNFTDVPTLLSPHEQLCSLVHAVLQTEEDFFKSHLAANDVLKSFKSKILPLVEQLQLCSAHSSRVQDLCTSYLGKVVMYKAINDFNRNLKESDARARERKYRGRTTHKRRRSDDEREEPLAVPSRDGPSELQNFLSSFTVSGK